MSENTSAREFDLHALGQLEKLFGHEELETLLWKSSGPSDSGEIDSAVLVKHLPSGKEVTSHKYQTQIRNKICCLLTLLLDTPR